MTAAGAPRNEISATGSSVAPTLAPGGEVVISDQTSPIVIQLQSGPQPDLVDPRVYAPAIPGVVVALAGLLIGHWLTLKRDRRKEVGDLCSALKKSADEAAAASIVAWASEVGERRADAIRETKRKLQALGIAATQLRRRSKRKIDATSLVSSLRQAATVDPFEDPERAPSDEQVGPIQAALANILVAIDDQHDESFP